jgi:hypothetical protein
VVVTHIDSCSLTQPEDAARRRYRFGRIAIGTALWFSACLPAWGATNFSAWASPGASGRVLQRPDGLGNRVLDYSNVGYKGGTVPLPNVPVKANVSPIAGDDGANIQAAINQVAAMPLDANGFRGAVLLAAGEYQISNSISINASGVVLRGAGDDTNGTVLRATGTGQRTLVRVSGSGSASTVSGTTHNITNVYVPVGARSFNVDSTSGLAVGDRVFVRRIATDQWIQGLGMDLLCCPPAVNPWTPGGYNIDSDRVITRVDGTRIMLDAPITCAIEQRYAGGTIRKYTWSGRISNVGIEYLRGVSDYVAADDEDHGCVLIQFNSTENAWVRNVTSQYFGYACVGLDSGTKFATVRDCQCLDPVSQVTGGRRYAFVLDDCQLTLVQNCYTRQDRHQFVTQSLTTGPHVFVDGLSDSARSDAGPHHRWGTGALWDAVTINGNNLNVQNRGNSGSGHGWAGANEVVWNCDADGGYVVQNPPTARNWLIGSIGNIENGTMYVGPHDPGTYDSHGSNVFPNSLYYAQLQDRLAAPNLQTREYRIGEVGFFTNATTAGEAVPAAAAWRAAIQSASVGAAITNFDLVASNQWIPFTFTFSLGSAERIVAASLVVSMRAASAGANDDVLYLDSTNNAFSFNSLGWLPISTGTNPTVRVLDLAAQLSLLADGNLNVAVQNDVGIDWAMLEIHVAPVLTANTNTLLPIADAYVRGGTYAADNFGSDPLLTVKQDSSASFTRRAYLRWDLSSVTGTVYHARVRLMPLNVGTNGLEQGVTLASSNEWSESSVNWNNEPGGGKRFATWIPGANAPVEFVVTPQVLDAFADDKQLSLELFSLRAAGGPGFVDYGARENPDFNSRPQLILVMNGPLQPTAPLRISSVEFTNNLVSLVGIGGPPGGIVRVLASTNVSLPAAQWSVVATNQFDAAGKFIFMTNPLNTDAEFYRLQR